MILHSKALGDIEVDDTAVLYAPEGLLGFEDLKKFVLLEFNDFQPFMWLASTEGADVGFAVADPQLFYGPHYEVGLTESDKDILDLQPGDTISVFVIVSIADGGRRVTANLKGPVVVNTRNRLAKQAVVYSPSYSVRQPLCGGESETIPISDVAARSRTAARG